MLGLLLGIYMAVTAQMPDTVKEYMHRKPKMPETVQEYMDRGREWTEYIESHNAEFCPNKPFLVDGGGNTEGTTENVSESQKSGVEGTYYSDMELTAYIWTGNPCADGVYPSEGYTAACNDPNLWHKWVYIEGVGTYYIHDTGGMSSNVIDIYVGDYDSAVQFGRQSSAVYILE